MDPKHFIPDESKEYYTEERCHILELLNIPDVANQSIARARVKPGVSTAWHFLDNTSEIYYILEGTGEVEIGKNFKKFVTKNEMVFIPKDTRQRITNVSDSDLIFLCFCVPRFEPNNYNSVK